MKLPLLACLLFGSLLAKPIPVLFDTDIGTDIDDAYALAQIVHSPELELLGVTTVNGDAVGRARLAAKLLAVAGRGAIPVHAGLSTPPHYQSQCDWATGYKSPSLHTGGAVEFLRAQIEARPGQVVLIAVGELGNVAALIEAHPAAAKKLKAIALMGGSVRRGYSPGSAAEPEWNIKSNIRAAQVVFSSGVPLLIAPLDSTSDLKLTTERKTRLFAHGTPLTDALAALDFVWTHTNTWSAKLPTLFDNLAVTLVATPDLVPLTALHLVVEADGTTREVADRPPNARVALTSDPAAFLDHFVARLVSPVR